MLTSKYGCEFREISVHLDGVSDSYPVPYFERKMGDKILQCVVVFPNDETERVALTNLRSICVRLEIPLADFHLDIDSSK